MSQHREKIRTYRPRPIPVQLRVLSPIHIGTGEAIQPTELVIDETKKQVKGKYKTFYQIYRADLAKITQEAQRQGTLREFYDLLEASFRSRTPNPKLHALTKKYPLYWLYANENFPLTREYREHVKTRNQAYIPGSSIKGAILSAVIHHALTELSYESHKIEAFLEKLLTTNPRNFLGKRSFDAVLSLAFAWLEQGSDVAKRFHGKESLRDKAFSGKKFMQWLLVSDTSLLPITGKTNLTVRLLERRGGSPSQAIPSQNATKTRRSTKTQGVSTLAECLAPKKTLAFSIELHPNTHLTLPQLRKIIDTHYTMLLEKEREWFTEKGINARIPQKTSPESTLIRVGFGSGLHSTSLMPFAKELEESIIRQITRQYARQWRLTKSRTPEVKTKWLARGQDTKGKIFYYPLGWAELTFA